MHHLRIQRLVAVRPYSSAVAARREAAEAAYERWYSRTNACTTRVMQAERAARRRQVAR
jgi:hypothetical protein